MFPISRSEKIPRKLSAKKREINSPESRLIACLSRPSFYFFSTFHRAKETRMPRASPRAYTRGHSWGQSRLRSSPPFHGGEKKKRRRYSGNARGRSGEGGCARESERRRDRFDEESEKARAAPKPYTRRSKETSVLSATMVTKRTGRSLSQPPRVHTSFLPFVPTDRAYA